MSPDVMQPSSSPSPDRLSDELLRLGVDVHRCAQYLLEASRGGDQREIARALDRLERLAAKANRLRSHAAADQPKAA